MKVSWCERIVFPALLMAIILMGFSSPAVCKDPSAGPVVKTGVKVYALHDPTHLKYKGRLKVTHTYLGAYEITVPAGKYETVLIRSSYAGKVGPAHVVDGGYAFAIKNVRKIYVF